MIWHPFFVMITGLLHALNSALPPWTISLGPGCSGSPGGGCSGSDGGMIHDFLSCLATFDRYFPVHDGLAIWLAIVMLYAVAMLIFKGVKMLISFIPTISAGG